MGADYVSRDKIARLEKLILLILDYMGLFVLYDDEGAPIQLLQKDVDY